MLEKDSSDSEKDWSKKLQEMEDNLAKDRKNQQKQRNGPLSSN